MVHDGNRSRMRHILGSELYLDYNGHRVNLGVFEM